MTQTTGPDKTKPNAVVFGARNLGKAIIGRDEVRELVQVELDRANE